MAGLIDARQTLLAALPDAFNQHPLSERLHANPQTMPLGQLLGGQRWAKVRVLRLDQRQDFRPHDRWMAAVAWLATTLGRQRGRTVRPILLGKPEDLTRRQTHQLRRLRHSEPSQLQIPQHLHAIDLPPAHRNHRHQPNAPQTDRRRVTSEMVTGVTSLSVTYRLDSQKIYYGTGTHMVCGPPLDPARARPRPHGGPACVDRLSIRTRAARETHHRIRTSAPFRHARGGYGRAAAAPASRNRDRCAGW